MTKSKTARPELLAPAGDLEKLKVALHFGADAVYVGLPEFSLRVRANNFSFEELRTALELVRAKNKKLYVALNVYFTPEQAESLIAALQTLEGFPAHLRPDALIVADLGALSLARQYAPSLALHISTQANATNQYAVQAYQALGATRVVLARELTLKQIRAIASAVPTLELEAFAHGAMCVAYSGRCLLSSCMTKEGFGGRKERPVDQRSANQGDCSHSCRWDFQLVESTRPDQHFDIQPVDGGTAILSSKDICMIRHLPAMLEAGISSFKIEGRMKSSLYVATIVRAYRHALDVCLGLQEPIDNALISRELDGVSHREYSTGFFFEGPGEDPKVYAGAPYQRTQRLVAQVTAKVGARYRLQIFNKLSVGDPLDCISPNMKTQRVGKIAFYREDGTEVQQVSHDQWVEAEIRDESLAPVELAPLDLLRVEGEF